MYGRRWVIRGLATTGAWAAAAQVSGVARASSGAKLSVLRIAQEHGEDGRGRSRKAVDPYALVLESDAGWIVRAVDPVLYIGDLHFHGYEHTGRKTLRFVVDDVSRLTAGESVYVQYGEDVQSRVRFPDLRKSW